MGSASDLNAAFRAGCNAQQQGNGQLAEAHFREVIEADPGHLDARYRLSAVLMHAHQLPAAAEQLDELTRLAPDQVGVRVRYAQVLAMLGRGHDSAAHMREAIRIDPADILMHLNHAMMCSQIGNVELALESFERARILAPELPAYANDQRVPARLRRIMRTGLDGLAKHHRDIVDATLDSVATEFPSADLTRLRSACESCAKANLGDSAAQQAPTMYYMPGLPAPGWYEREQLPWIEAVEALYPQIQSELDALLASGADFHPYLAEDIAGTSSGSSLVGSMEWNAFHLYCGDEVFGENCAQCPTAATAVDVAASPRIRHYSPEVFFSRLRPGAVIEPHYGLMNVRLTCHLALQIPLRTGIRVADETRHWQPGKVLAFDDSVRHAAWNESDQERIVLIFEAWNPDLSDAERFGVEQFFERRRDWLDRFEDDPLLPPRGTQPRLEW